MTEANTSNGISETVGRARFADDTTTVVYRALRQLVCSACARPIEPETLFTRRTLPGQTLLIMPQCTECAPFEFQKEGADRARSALMRSLLDTQTPTRSEQSTRTGKPAPLKTKKDEAEAEKVQHEVERRLGPALLRSRRPRR